MLAPLCPCVIRHCFRKQRSCESCRVLCGTPAGRMATRQQQRLYDAVKPCECLTRVLLCAPLQYPPPFLARSPLQVLCSP
jgi:hypothetical protein